METAAPKAQGNGSTALVSVQIQEAVARALQDVQHFIDSAQAREKMQYVLVRQVAENTELQRCSPESFALAVYDMFKLGLDPRGQNEVWMIAYKGKAKAQTGYAGKRKLALNDARVDDVFSKAVHQNDTYELDPRTGQPLHTYSPFKPRGAIIGYYGAVRYTNGSWHTEEMDLPAMRAWKDTFSRAAQKAVWAEDRGTDGLKPCSFDGMALKTMLSRICHTKHMSLSPEAQEALVFEEKLYGHTKDVTPEASPYVPTDEEHTHNIQDVFGDDGADDARERATRTPVPRDREQPVAAETDQERCVRGEAAARMREAREDASGQKEGQEPPAQSNIHRVREGQMRKYVAKLAGGADVSLVRVWDVLDGVLLDNGLRLGELTPDAFEAAKKVAGPIVARIKDEKAGRETPLDAAEDVPPPEGGRATTYQAILTMINGLAQEHHISAGAVRTRVADTFPGHLDGIKDVDPAELDWYCGVIMGCFIEESSVVEAHED